MNNSELTFVDLVRDCEESSTDFVALLNEVMRYRQLLTELLQIAVDKQYLAGPRLMAIIAKLESALQEEDYEQR